MKFDDKYKLIVVGISGVLAGVVVIMFICCYENKKKKFQLPEPPQTPEWQRQIVSAPTLQTRNIDVGNDRLWGKSETVVKKSVIPLRPNAVDNTLRYQGPKRDDVTPAASTSAFAGDCGGSSGGDNGCDGGHSGGGGGCGGGGGGGGCGGC
ncbi:hypothetical protein AXX17_AT1G48070 [Arabidopsis thaliana]|uniref:Uncharacterized protein n=1 Tax=Arabidopsis thaliana TaxID=3702 RepID=A0A178WE13_ARATH|nr:hypothetical protein AXX17_AT1G48070 [Arabidopsis thaliana]